MQKKKKCPRAEIETMNIEHLNNLKKKSIKLKNPNMQRLTVEKKANERKKKLHGI